MPGRLKPTVDFHQQRFMQISESHCGPAVIDYRHPAGVEWQGVFEDEAEQQPNETKPGAADQVYLLADSESEDSDYGQYSLVVRADRRKCQLTIADPYKDYISQDRVFGFEVFDRRWYDFNEVPDPISGLPVLVEDDHLIFVITRRNGLFPQRMGMRTFSV